MRAGTGYIVADTAEVETLAQRSIGVICAAISNWYVITTINIDAWIIQSAGVYMCVRVYVCEPSVSHFARLLACLSACLRACPRACLHACVHVRT